MKPRWVANAKKINVKLKKVDAKMKKVDAKLKKVGAKPKKVEAKLKKVEVKPKKISIKGECNVLSKHRYAATQKLRCISAPVWGKDYEPRKQELYLNLYLMVIPFIVEFFLKTSNPLL